MGKDAMSRVRRRIRERLDELGMTGRELVQAMNPPKSDAWISGILAGSQGLQLENLDEVAAILRLSPTELTRHDDADLRELTPSEMRLLRHYQNWPSEIQQRWLRMLDYFAASAPDPDGAKLLDRWRDLPLRDRRALHEFLDTLERRLRGNFPPTGEPSNDPQATGAGPAAPDATRPFQPGQTPGAARPPAVDPSPDDPNHS